MIIILFKMFRFQSPIATVYLFLVKFIPMF